MSTAHVQAPRSSPSSPIESPRKRRRRAPTTGAADDCFTCAGKSLQCDRRRPYCSKCLDDGKDCAGYKTTLTWGVGVASRGKLRGLSLPIAGGQRVGPPEGKGPSKKRKSLYISGSIAHTILSEPSSILGKPTVASAPAPNHATEFTTPRTHSGQPAVTEQTSWLHKPTVIPVSASPIFKSSSQFQPPSQAPAGRSPHEFVTTYRNISRLPSQPPEVDLEPSLLYSNSPQDTTFFSMPFQGHNANVPVSQSSSIQEQKPRGGWHNGQACSHTSIMSDSIVSPTHDTSPSAATHLFGYSNFSSEQAIKEESVDEVVYGNTGIANVNSSSFHDVVMPAFSSPLSEYALSLSPFTGTASVGKTPRMRYLIHYYAEVISPVIVAFDSPSNPYRTHILQLAANSETLQHAISALSASNLRQRKETGALSKGKTDPARRSSIAHLTLTESSWQSGVSLLSAQDQAQEEAYHKAISIQSLNAQLANPLIRKDDSILATLLVLCLFHICDSGIAKFKTQFAGVKKLLGLRGKELGSNSRETKWFIRMFTWFDAMTATVNDREGQLGDDHLDMSALSDEEWALENLAGCDGQLFKTIAKLGRLNVLSQGRKLDSRPTDIMMSLTIPMPSAPNVAKYDGNDWSQTVGDEDLSNSTIEAQFWHVWRQIRHDLQTWTLDTSLFDSASTQSSRLTAEQRVDLANISESFRCSAMLYTERLASPAAASSDPNIQAWVRHCLSFIQQVKSDVFLLWPLFITGSECASEEDRDVIRERCMDIQKDSGFYNNRSCLELLEKVWLSNPPYSSTRETTPSSREIGFTFTNIMRMEQNDGEYIVV